MKAATKAPPVPPEGHDPLCPCSACLDLKVSRSLELRLFLLAIRKIVDETQEDRIKACVAPDSFGLLHRLARIGKLAALGLGRPYPGPKARKAAAE